MRDCLKAWPCPARRRCLCADVGAAELPDPPQQKLVAIGDAAFRVLGNSGFDIHARVPSMDGVLNCHSHRSRALDRRWKFRRCALPRAWISKTTSYLSAGRSWRATTRKIPWRWAHAHTAGGRAAVSARLQLSDRRRSGAACTLVLFPRLPSPADCVVSAGRKAGRSRF